MREDGDVVLVLVFEVIDHVGEVDSLDALLHDGFGEADWDDTARVGFRHVWGWKCAVKDEDGERKTKSDCHSRRVVSFKRSRLLQPLIQ